MKIVKAIMRKVDLPLKHPFETSFSSMSAKKCIILELEDEDGTKGYAECSAFDIPFYNEEFREGAWLLLKDQLLPHIIGQEIEHPDNLYARVDYIRRNNMSKSAINCALWDIFAKQAGVPLATALGGDSNKDIEVGVSIGVQESPEKLVQVVNGFIQDGYRRVKIKIKPGKDIDYLRAVRSAFPDIELMADANSAYTLDDLELFQQLDTLDLIMVEQPLAPDDLVDHATLQAQIQTAICLDESVTSLEDTRKAIQLGSGKIINIKVARVGGFTVAKQIQAFAQANGIECWCGGMLDTGIARAGNIAIASLSGYTLANDIAASHRYYAEDLIDPTVELNGSFVAVPSEPGLGYSINRTNIDRYTIESLQVK